MCDEVAAGWLAVKSCKGASSREEVEAADELRGLDDCHLVDVLGKVTRRPVDKDATGTAWALRKADDRAYFTYLAKHPEVYAEQLQQRNRWREGLPQVLMVAEKPSVARLVAEFLCPHTERLRERRGLSPACPVLEFAAVFPPTGQRSVICVTSVIGHIFQLEFDDRLPKQLAGIYEAPVVKTFTDSARKARVAEHLQELAEASSHLCLWLDADREGENIGFEVIAVCRDRFPDNSNVHRAIFSALTREEVAASFNQLGRPDMAVAQGVDARQELDLRVGISFSRLLTRQLSNTRLGSVKRGASRSITYGPCQTPALGFCAQRQQEIDSFQPQKRWTPEVELRHAGSSLTFVAASDTANMSDVRLFAPACT